MRQGPIEAEGYFVGPDGRLAQLSWERDGQGHDFCYDGSKTQVQYMVIGKVDMKG
jgi:hypothetical protein